MTERRLLRAVEGDVRHLLTEQFRRGDDVALEVAPRMRKVAFNREVDLAPVASVVEEAMRKFASTPAKSDAWLGPRLHATLRVSSRTMVRRPAANRDCRREPHRQTQVVIRSRSTTWSTT